MDWLLLIALVVLLIIAGAGVFALYRFAVKIKREFQGHLPALRITNMSAMNAGEVVTLTPVVENVGGGVAHDCIVQLAGWEGSFAVKTIHPIGPRYQRHSVPMVLGPHAPIRMKVMSRCSLRIAYRDRWEQRYECWYPVTQIKNVKTSLYDIQIQLSEPELTEPHPSIREMWTLLRGTHADEASS